MILVDFSNVIYGSIFAQTKGGAIQDNELLRHMVCNSLRKLKEKHGRKYGRMVLCFDSGNPWRREYYPHYKAKRKAQRAEKNQDDVREMFDFMNQLQRDLEDYSPYPCVYASRCEADDVVAVLAMKTASEGEDVLIVSQDTDFYQLHSNRISQYLNRKNKIVSCECPNDELNEKIARGDSSDSIPNCLSDDDVFVTEGKRQKPMRASVVAQVVRGQFPTAEAKRNWDRNKKLIDLTEIPEEYSQLIVDEYDSAADAKYPSTTRGMDFYKYLASNKMHILAEQAQVFMNGE
jgi:hypothetical protein